MLNVHLVYGLHLVGVAEYPLLVGVGCQVIGGGVVGRHVEEQVAVLRRRVLGTVRSWQNKIYQSPETNNIYIRV